MVVFVSDENDCSHGAGSGLDTSDADACEWERDKLTPTAEYREFLLALKADPANQIGVAALVGPRSFAPERVPVFFDYTPGAPTGTECDPATGSCACEAGICLGRPQKTCVSAERDTTADAGWRYLEFAEMFGEKQGIGCPIEAERGDEACNSICEDRFDGLLQQVAELSLDLGRTFCLDRAPRCQVLDAGQEPQPCDADARQYAEHYGITVRVDCPPPVVDDSACGLRDDWELLLERGDCGGGVAIRLERTAPAEALVTIDYAVEVGRDGESVQR